MGLSSYEEQMKVLHGDFDFDTHNKTFTDYCEVVILEDGKIEYAIPSHTEKLIEVTCKKFDLTRQQFLEMTDVDNMRSFYFEICSYNSKCVMVSNHECRFFFIPNEKQLHSLQQLIAHGCIDLQTMDAWFQNIRHFEEMNKRKEYVQVIMPKIKRVFQRQ